MTLSNESVQEFRRMYRDYFHENLSDEEARLAASELVRLVALIQPHKEKSSDTDQQGVIIEEFT